MAMPERIDYDKLKHRQIESPVNKTETESSWPKSLLVYVLG